MFELFLDYRDIFDLNTIDDVLVGAGKVTIFAFQSHIYWEQLYERIMIKNYELAHIWNIFRNDL